MEKVMFTKSIDIIPVRKGIYKDVMQDTVGFRLFVAPQAIEKSCDRLSCKDCENDGNCEQQDVEKHVRKAKPVARRRRWGEDPEYDEVMRNFGQTPGKPGEEVEQRLVFGWANVSIQEDGSTPFDWQGDTIATEELEAAAYNFVLSHGIANQEHEWGTECGWLVESMMFTKEKMAALGIAEGTVPEGWFVGFYIPDPDVYKKVKDGEYNMFSIEGYGRRIPLDGVMPSDVTYDQY